VLVSAALACINTLVLNDARALLPEDPPENSTLVLTSALLNTPFWAVRVIDVLGDAAPVLDALPLDFKLIAPPRAALAVLPEFALCNP
jgi:hypothetical protein